MTDNEKQFENFVREIKFDDTPDHSHRDKLEQDLLAALANRPWQKDSPIQIWRIIMKSNTTKLAAAAAVLIVISVVGWLSSNPNISEPMSSFTFLSKACAAEQTLFYGTNGIAHIANEIILYPDQERDLGELLSELEADVTKDKDIAFLKSWLSYRWLPVYSLGADGRLCEHKIGLDKKTGKAITMSDLSWYNAATGQFARVIKANDQVLFANAYDGESIYMVQKGLDGGLRIKQETVTGEFQVPENPADFLGIAAGIRGSIPREQFPPIQDVTTKTLEDGTPVRVYKLGFADPWGNVDTYYLFKISTDTDIIAEIECVVKNRTTRVHRRVVTETVDSPEFSWNLAELAVGATGDTSVNVEDNVSVQISTVQELAQRATFPVYIFAENPPWTSDRMIYDTIDEMSASGRLFITTYCGKDGRDVLLGQGEAFNRYFAAVLRKVQELRETVSWTYVSENEFKVLQGDKEGVMWWTEVVLKSSGFEPAANRVGYILQSPAGTYLILAINGPVSEQELQSLIDSLVPAEDYISSSD